MMTSTGGAATALDRSPPRENTSPAARRRQRILDAALHIAETGGYEAVQMRAVAESADVAVGTLYRYFTSKDRLLITAFDHELDRLHTVITAVAPDTGDAYQRLSWLVDRLCAAMQARPRFTEAVMRTWVSADTSVLADVAQVGQRIELMFVDAMADGKATDDQHAIARIVCDVWLASLIPWLSGRASLAHSAQRVQTALRLLFREPSGHR